MGGEIKKCIYALGKFCMVIGAELMMRNRSESNSTEWRMCYPKPIG